MPVLVSENDLAKVVEFASPKGSPQRDAESARAATQSARMEVYKNLQMALVNAVPREHTAILAVFGEGNPIPSWNDPTSSIRYVVLTLQSGQEAFVVISGITGQGIAQAAAATAQIKNKCPFVERIVMVGLAAGQPNLLDGEKDVRLGDVVVGNEVIQYDHVKLNDDGSTEFRGGNLQPSDTALVLVAEMLRSRQNLLPEAGYNLPWEALVQPACQKLFKGERPPAESDKFHGQRAYQKGLEVRRDNNHSYIHIGKIGSASTLLKSEKYREKIYAEHRTIAYEMEGAGLAIAASTARIDYLMVRGICDYADRDKMDTWQLYAAICAAAFARTVIEWQ